MDWKAVEVLFSSFLLDRDFPFCTKNIPRLLCRSFVPAAVAKFFGTQCANVCRKMHILSIIVNTLGYIGD